MLMLYILILMQQSELMVCSNNNSNLYTDVAWYVLAEMHSEQWYITSRPNFIFREMQFMHSVLIASCSVSLHGITTVESSLVIRLLFDLWFDSWLESSVIC